MHGSTTIGRSQTRPQSRHDSTVVDRQSHAFLHGSVVVDHHSKAITRFPQIHPKLRMKCWCLLRNGAAPLRRGADLHGMSRLHVTLTLTLHSKVSDCMLPKSPGFTDPEDVTHKMQAGSPGLTEADVDSKKSSPIDFSRVFDTRRDCESPHGSCRRRQRDSRERSPMTS